MPPLRDNMRVHVWQAGKLIHLDVQPSDTIDSVKAQIRDRVKPDVLTFEGTPLEDDLTLDHYGITEGAERDRVCARRSSDTSRA